MPYLYLVVSVFMSASSSVFGKMFNRTNDKKTDATIFYNFFLLSSVAWGGGFYMRSIFHLTQMCYGIQRCLHFVILFAISGLLMP